MFYKIDESNTFPILYDQKNQVDIRPNQIINDIREFLQNFISNKKALCFIYCDQSYDTVLAYISLLNSKHAIFMGDSGQNKELKRANISIYKPKWIWSPVPLDWIKDYSLKSQSFKYLYERVESCDYKIDTKLKILLSSSGSTGSPKMIRLSEKNLQSNASSIVKYLKINNKDISITTLPLHYSFGLSVLNSFLETKAKVVLTNESLLSRSFWSVFKNQKVSFLAGVPYTYDILLKLNFFKMDISNLNYLVQAGGKMEIEKTKFINMESKKNNINFYVMYGQTEATARISYVPPNRLQEKIGSIGISIPGGELSLKKKKDGVEEGELIYKGPNVMLGYSNSISDLAISDVNKSILNTGDLAYKDKDGFYYLIGRINRFVKLYGLRVNLDEVEMLISEKLGCVCICFEKNEYLEIRIESNNKNYLEKTKLILKDFYNLRYLNIVIKLVKKIPRNNVGKVLYSNLS